MSSTTTCTDDTATAQEFYDKYEAKEEIGRGMTSVVKRCVRRATGEQFAVKIIDLAGESTGPQQGHEIRASTHNEIRILSEISGHANIIRLIETFEISTSIFLVFELLARGELFDYLTEVVKCGERQTRRIMRELLTAVEHLHARDIVHRDIKPENILLDELLHVHLSDFGFAAQGAEGVVYRELLGTPGYMAPEMLKCSTSDRDGREWLRGYGKEIDVWACGVVMYSLLAGAPPFWHRKQLVMLRRIVEGRYSFHKTDWQDVSHAAKDLIARLLVVDPAARLTAHEALAHPFFSQAADTVVKPPAVVVVADPAVAVRNRALRRFRVISLAVLASCCVTVRWRRALRQPVRCASEDPYAVKRIRRVIDASAFRVYGHWVQKAGDQNRAVLFENGTRSRQCRASKLEGDDEYGDDGEFS